MPNDINSLEYEADQHRAHAANALSALVDRFAPARMGQDAVGAGTDLAGTLGRTALREAKRNPAGLALIGTGVALLIAGMNRGPERPDAQGTETDRIAAADARIKAKAQITAGPSVNATGMRAMLDKGLDKLPPDARERVTQARLSAIDAQEKIERQARRVAAQARDAHSARPFATALAVAGVGALAGALLPSTRTEGHLLGAKRDQMMRHAESILQAELDALETRGKNAVTAGTQAARAEISRASQA